MRRSPSSRRGISILEVVVTTAILGAILGPLFALSLTGARVAADTAALDDSEGRARRAVDRLGELLRAATWTSVSTYSGSPSWGSSISFNTLNAVTMSSGAVTVRGMQVLWERDPADSDDGNDNDKDGLVDEGHVVVVYDVGTSAERRIVVARRVPERLEGETANGADENGNALADESGLCFTREGRGITVRVTVVTASKSGTRKTETAVATFRPRN